VLDYLITFVEDEDAPAWQGYAYSLAMFGAAVLQSIFLHQVCSAKLPCLDLPSRQYFHRVMTTGMRLRSAVATAVFQKSLRLSNSARQGTTVGEMVNLMTVDAQVKRCFTLLH
jgi:hypothetical protein